MGRSPLPKNEREYEITELWEHHNEILRRLNVGQRVMDIAREMGVSQAMVSYVKNSEVGRDKLATLRQARDESSVDLARDIQELGPVAIQRLRENLEDDETNPSLQFRTAQDILDRIPETSKKQHIEGRIAHAHLTAEDLAKLRDRADQAKKERIDAHRNKNGEVAVDG